MLNYIMTEFDKSIAAYQECLPAKCLKHGYPNGLWIQAPLHKGFKNNNERQKFNRSLEDVSKFHVNSSTLQLKKVWDSDDDSLFISENQCFTSIGYIGYRRYWEAVDKTIRYFDSTMLKKHEK